MSRSYSILQRLLPKSRFARSVSVLAGGTAAGQLIIISASPILTRLYTPEDFGLLAVYAGILGILGVIASLRYQLAIPLPESDKEAASIVIVSLIMVMVTTLCSVMAVCLLGDHLVRLLNTPSLAPYLWLIPVGLFLVGIYQVFQYWAIRTKAFADIARTKLTQSAGMVATQIAGHAFGPVALLLGRVVGQSAGIFALIMPALKKNRSDFGSTTRIKVQCAAREYKSYPLISTWTGLASSGGSNLPPILIAAFMGVGPAGMFALAHRVLSQPMAIFGKAIGDVFYRQATEAYREGTLDYAVSRVYSGIATLALPSGVVAFILIPDLFTFVFGQSWHQAGEVARWMLPWLLLQLVVTPSTRVYPILGLHGLALRFQLSLLTASVLSVLVGGLYLDSLVGTVALMSILNALIYIWRAIYTFSLVGLSKKKAVIELIKPLPVSFLCSIPIIIVAIRYKGIFEAGLVGGLMVFFSFILLVVFSYVSWKKVVMK